MAETESEILRVENLRKYFPILGGFFKKPVAYVRAVDDVSLSIKKKETFGLVGESGCGKTTLGRTVGRLIEPDSGRIIFRGMDITHIPQKEFREIRKHIQFVFQDPFASLNPRMTIKDIVGEPLVIHTNQRDSEIEDRVLELLEVVGLKKEHLYRYPHEFSGGQRQRINIARALALNPDFIVLDEPTSALDVSVQAQILNLLKDLQRDFDLTYLFISHDLSVVEYMSDTIGVMYLGKIVEVGEAESVIAETLHPYTKALFESVPIPDPKYRGRGALIQGDVPSPINPPSGCRFHPRCPHAMDVCRKREPVLKGNGNHMVACHLY
jgi:oligopeptide/dipeptide ABC transporter ATP-binding protein